jgi:hypothetical protein
MAVAEKFNRWLPKKQKNLKQSQSAYLAKATERNKSKLNSHFDWDYLEDKRRVRDENNYDNLLFFKNPKAPKYEQANRSRYRSVYKQSEIDATFTLLANEWLQETRGMSSINQMSMHPKYQQIIGMGEVVVPLLLRELERKSGHWFWALKSITRADPVPPEYRGKVKEMIKAWLEWGRQRGYKW